MAFACSIWVLIASGLIRRRTSPFLTIELKSTGISWMMPPTCEPTVTAVTASSVPVALTDSVMSPRDTGEVETFGSGPGRV